MSPRPRSRDKVVPMSIGIPLSLMMRLNNELEYTQSRSKWVTSAIIAKLDALEDESMIISDLSSQRLLAILFNRNVIDLDRFTLLSMLVEETASKQ